MQGSSKSYFKPFYPIDEQYKSELPFIAAIRPFDGEIEVEWYDFGDDSTYRLEIYKGDKTVTKKIKSNHIRFASENGEKLKIAVVDEKNPERRSDTRTVAAGIICGFPVNFLSPEDTVYSYSGNSLCSPCILKLSEKSLLVSMDVYKGRGGQNLTKIFRSDDGGESWFYVTDLFPCFWGKLFINKGVLYMLSMTTEYGNLQIARSLDEGKTWSDFVKLFNGSGNRDAGGPHKAPVNVTEYNNRLWTDIDFGTWEKPTFHSSAVLSVDVDADFMNPENWILSELLPFSNDWEGAPEGQSRGCLEGNTVILPDGNLYDLLRYQIHTCSPSCDKAVLLRVDTKHPENKPEFYKIIDFSGGLSKSSVLYDEETKLYISLANRVADLEHVMGRNVVALSKSSDCIHWEAVCDLVGTEVGGDNYAKVGVQYPDALVDGDDIIWVQRTACNNSVNFHDSNYITFHRFKNFRKYL